MTLITRVPGTPDTTLPAILPDFGLQVDHFWHPRSFTPGDLVWRDEVGSLHLPVNGTVADMAIASSGAGRPLIRTKSTAGFRLTSGVDPSEIRTFFVVAGPQVGDAQSGFPYVVNLGQGGIAQVATDDTATTVPTTTGTFDAPRGKYHLYAVTSPTNRLFEFTVDAQTKVLATAAGGDNNAINLAQSSSQKRELRIAAAWSSKQVYPAATIASTVFPAVKAWFSDLTW